MKILLFGATGFVGSYVLKEALDRGHEVTAILRTPQKLKEHHVHLRVEQGDVLQPENLISITLEHDIVISAYNAGWNNPNLYQEFLQGSRNVQHICKQAEVHRLLVIGGAGSLEISPGHQLVDSDSFPQEWKQGALAARDYLNELQNERDLDWVYLSPAIEMHPGTSGQRKGTYRTGFNHPLFDENGVCKISVEDTAVAILDEAERPQFNKQRFTIAW